MDWTEALDLFVARTRHERMRFLCSDGNPDHMEYRALVVRLAMGEPESPPTPDDLALRAYVENHGCGCG